MLLMFVYYQTRTSVLGGGGETERKSLHVDAQEIFVEEIDKFAYAD